MMKFKIKYYLLSVIILISILANDRLILFGEFVFSILSNIFYSFGNIYSLNPYSSVDYLFVFILYISAICFMVFKWNSKYSNTVIKTSSGAISTLLFLIILFPLISGHESFIGRESIKISKLAPLTKLNYFTKLSSTKQIENQLNIFRVKNSESHIYFQSYTDEEKIKFVLNGNVEKIDKKLIQHRNGRPIVGTRIFILGTDEFGSDLLTEIIFGIRKSIFIALFASFISFFIGSVLGYYSGISIGFYGNLINRMAETIFSIPAIIFFVIILLFWGSNGFTIPAVLGLAGWITIFKLVRNEVIIIKQKPFFLTSQKLGLSNYELLKKEIIPFISPQLSVAVVFMFINFIITESSLSFIGLGNEETYSSLGNIIQRGNYYLPEYYWITFLPTAALAIILIVLNYFKDKLKKIIDPRLQ